ncbi:MAG: PilZ domain-containing protein [Novosphingobium sp.]|nr:PilZ domain-containing protein [Novosphingobium sp.]
MLIILTLMASPRPPRSGKRDLPAKPLAHVAVKHCSSAGCQLVADDLTLESGQVLKVRIAGIVTLSGTVRWVLPDRAGFAFDEPLPVDKVRQVRQPGRSPPSADVFPT